MPIVLLLSSRETTNKGNTFTYRNFIFYKKTKRKQNVNNTSKRILRKRSLTEIKRKITRLKEENAKVIFTKTT